MPMTDIALPEDRAAELEPARRNDIPDGAGTSALVLWAYEAQQAHNIARSLARTSFVPASLRNKPEDITAAILAGQELGLQPMASLRSMDVIQGTPALRAHAMRGLVQSHGHQIELVESTDQHCKMRGRRKGEGWQEVIWDLDRAAKLGLLSKDQWKKQPRTMLVARATGEICRLVAADVLYAMPYAAEELWGSVPDGESGGASAGSVPQVTAAEISQWAPQSPAGPQAATADEPAVASVSGPPTNGAGGNGHQQAALGADDWPEPAKPGGGS